MEIKVFPQSMCVYEPRNMRYCKPNRMIIEEMPTVQLMFGNKT